MEPIGFLTAPLRRWPVLIPCVLVAIIVALLIPSSTSSAYPTSTWQANAEVGVAPAYHENKLGAKIGINQLAYFAKSPVVLAAAAQQAGIPDNNKLKNSVVVTKAKGGKQSKTVNSNVLLVAVQQPTKHGAVELTNDFTGALGGYLQAQLANQHKNALYIIGLEVQNLQTTIASLPVKPPTTTTTLPHIKKVKTPTTHPTTTTTTHPPTTTTTKAAHSLGAPTSKVELTADVVGSSTTTSTSLLPLAGQSTTGGTVPVTSSGTGTGSPTTIPGTPSSGGTTSPSIPNHAVAVERTVLANELGQALAQEQALKAGGVPASGYKVVTPAAGGTATQLSSSGGTLSNGWIRFLLGLLIGLVIGVLVTWLLDGFDRRIRTRRRAEEVFGLPVVTEVPAAAANNVSVIPVVDIVVDPYSPTSEAYRQLHVAILTAPAVTWVKHGGFEMIPAPPEPTPAAIPVGAGPAPEGAGDQITGSQPAAGDTARLPVAVNAPGLASPRRSRFSILITSPDDEPTRSLVVVNLAAVFAEAGDRVLVATTSGMRTEFEGNGRGPQMWQGETGNTTPSDLVANARPSQIPGVSSLALGQVFSNPSRLAANVGGLVDAARDVVDVLLLEAPLLSTQDGAAMLPAVDLVVVVAECWRTTIAEGIRTQRMLAQRRPPTLGLVLTNSKPENELIDAGRNL